MTSYRPLRDGWTVTSDPAIVAADGPIPVALPDTIPATVPGCVHTDLLAAGLIPDPYLDRNELDLAWIGHTDWIYTCTFDWPGAGVVDAASGVDSVSDADAVSRVDAATDVDSVDGASGGDAASGVEGPYGASVLDGVENVDLVCDGLDTVATVTVNGIELARTANMHRQYRFPVTSALVAGENTVQIRFASAYRYAEAQRDELGARPNAYPEPFNFIRKMASNFGWDWGPTVVTAGIWRSIGLESWRHARLDRVRPVVTVEEDRGLVRLHARLSRSSHRPVRLRATISGDGREFRTELEMPAEVTETVLDIAVPDPRRWWPHGLGEPDRYDVQLTLLDPGGLELDVWQRRIGFRTVELDTSADERGSAYTVVVNGTPVFVRGVNWIPDDALVTRVDRERYATRLHQARDANCNYLRVWGGGIYESEDFYDLADELGLMVGQDFLFACAAYPEEEPLRSEVAAEAEQAIVRLAHHPSLLIWTGNNENIWGFADWEWQEKLEGHSWGAGYYYELLPRLMQELDPTRPYWPGSPYSGTQDLHPNDPAHGSMHIWEVWNRDDYATYRDYRPRFVGEFGFQAPPAYATLQRALADRPLAADSAGMLHHQKAEDGNGKLDRGLAAHLPPPRDFDDWHYLTQVNQARAMSLGIEYFRSLRPYCMGAVVWQLNDVWPVTSWSAVDGDGRLKPLWFALRHSFSPRLLTFQPDGDDLSLVAVNDGATPWAAQATVTRYTLAGEPQAKHSLDLTVPVAAGQTTRLPPELFRSGRPDELLRVQSRDAEAWWFFAEDKDIPYPSARFTTAVTELPGAVKLTVTARAVLRDLSVFPDRLDPRAVVSDALVNLLPGEQFTFTVRTDESLSIEHLSSRPVLRCVNDIPR